MKWCSITKDDINFLNLNKLRDNVIIDSYDECLKFIHKKNPAKGKLSSIVLKGPYVSNDILKWIIYYEMPINKNHTTSEWKLCSPDETITVFNGAVLIYTKSKLIDKKEKLYPNIRETIDIDINSAVDWKLSTLQKRLLQEAENESDNDEDEDEDEDDEDEDGNDAEDVEDAEEENDDNDEIELIDEDEDDDEDGDDKNLNEIDNCSDDLDNSDYKVDELLFDDNNVINNDLLSKNVNLTKEDTNCLKYESYTYNANYIPF